MAKSKKADKSLATVTGRRFGKWGGKSKQIVTPSGAKLLFEEEDQEAILVFIGKKDIAEFIESDIPVYRLTFHDGKKFVSIPASFKLTECEFEPDHFYHIRLAAKVPNKNKGFNPMKDFDVSDIGLENETIKAADNPLGEDIVLTLDSIARLNYNYINYPLRKNVLPKE